jgi:hypothetical protein
MLVEGLHMTKLEEFRLQLTEADRKIAEYEDLREQLLFRIDELEGE